MLTLYGFALLGNLVVSFIAGKNEGRVSAGTIAGFWFGAIVALVAGLSVLARDALFAQHLASTVWLGDQFGDLTCKGARGSILIGCEVGDDVGFAANSLLLLPLIGLLVGTCGGALGRLFTRRENGTCSALERCACHSLDLHGISGDNIYCWGCLESLVKNRPILFAWRT